MKNLQFNNSFTIGLHCGRGFSLIELLVSMAIGLIVTLAITTTLIKNESTQRSSTALNDVSQTANYSTFSIDRVGRSAGSGFSQFRRSFGCLLHAAAGTVPILPPSAPLPDPFNSTIGGTVPIRLAPILIIDGGANSSSVVTGSDQLLIMGGEHGGSQNALVMKPGTATATTMNVSSTFDLAGGDMVIVAETTPNGNCMVQQVGSTSGNMITFGGTYFQSVAAGVSLATMGSNKMAAVFPIGNASSANSQPSFFAYGINIKNQLVRYNLLNPNPTPTADDAVPMAENIVSLQAIYGTSAATAALNDPAVTATPLVWIAPTGAFAASTSGLLVDGTIATNETAAKQAQNDFSTIKAVRVAMVVKSPILEKEPVSPTTLDLFSDIPSQTLKYNLPAGEEYYRHRIIETLIPIRNM